MASVTGRLMMYLFARKLRVERAVTLFSNNLVCRVVAIIIFFIDIFFFSLSLFFSFLILLLFYFSVAINTLFKEFRKQYNIPIHIPRSEVNDKIYFARSTFVIPSTAPLIRKGIA